MEERKTHHAKVPDSLIDLDLTYKDIFVYTCIKKHMSLDSMGCYPSTRTLAKLTKSSESTVLTSIKKLEKEGAFKITKRGRSNWYSFTNLLSDYEMISNEFIDNEKTPIPTYLKAYLICLQKHLFKEGTNGVTTYSVLQLSKLLKIPYTTIRKYNEELKNLNILSEEVMNKIDEAGFKKKKLTIDSTKINQDLMFLMNKAKEHDAAINDISSQLNNKVSREEVEEMIKSYFNKLSQLPNDYKDQLIVSA